MYVRLSPGPGPDVRHGPLPVLLLEFLQQCFHPSLNWQYLKSANLGMAHAMCEAGQLAHENDLEIKHNPANQLTICVLK